MISTFSGEPVAISELLRPLASANSATKTATTSAIVPTVISVLMRLTTRLRRLYFRGIAIKLFLRLGGPGCLARNEEVETRLLLSGRRAPEKSPPKDAKVKLLYASRQRSLS